MSKLADELKTALDTQSKERLIEVIMAMGEEHTRLAAVAKSLQEAMSIAAGAIRNAQETGGVTAEANDILEEAGKRAIPLVLFAAQLMSGDPSVQIGYADEQPAGTTAMSPFDGNSIESALVDSGPTGPLQ